MRCVKRKSARFKFASGAEQSIVTCIIGHTHTTAIITASDFDA